MDQISIASHEIFWATKDGYVAAKNVNLCEVIWKQLFLVKKGFAHLYIYIYRCGMWFDKTHISKKVKKKKKTEKEWSRNKTKEIKDNGSSKGTAHERWRWRRKLCKQLLCSGILNYNVTSCSVYMFILLNKKRFCFLILGYMFAL